MKRYILLIIISFLLLPGVTFSEIINQMEIPHSGKLNNIYIFKIDAYKIIILQNTEYAPKDKWPRYKYHLQIKNDKQLVYQEQFEDNMITDVYHLKISKKNYLLLNEWSGGAHCCYFWDLYDFNSKKIVKIIKIDMENFGESYHDNIFELNNQLFIKLWDGRFSYFYASFRGSFGYENYYLIKNNKLLPAYKNFINKYEDGYTFYLRAYDNFIQKYVKQLSAGDEDLREDLVQGTLGLITYGYYTNKKGVFPILNKNKKMYDKYEIDLKKFYDEAITKLKKD